MAYKPDISIANTPLAHASILTTTGVYIYKQKNIPIYIGKAVNLKARLASHRQNAKTDLKEAQIQELADAIDVVYTESEFLALVLESELISHFKPKYNVRWRDDKSYLYIKITVKEPYPKVLIVRKEYDDKAKYFGPFDSMKSVEGVLRGVRRVVPFCMQKSLQKRACFYHKLGLCDPCPSAIHSVENKIIQEKLKRTYRANIRLIVKILEGKTELVSRYLQKEIRLHTQKQEYEHAMKLRDSLYHLEKLLTHGSFIHTTTQMASTPEKALHELKELITPFFPTLTKLHRIECYDNSTLDFDHATASMVVFTDGRIDKKEYKRFKLKLSHTSDFEMMQEVMIRRNQNTKWSKPHLIVIDGGKPQLKAVEKVMSQLAHQMGTPSPITQVPYIGIAKHPDRIIIGVPGFPTLRPLRHHRGFRLIQHLRDEAHRFAKKYHTYLRDKTKSLV
ncbi:MAG TPA: GIY-YIG nuclease family protein [Candidatus Woesebacteria bacterium]|nr:GIY-YIG nuclease family protein [Candidatus Woesebacteria bacterium]HNS94507.1 GIY-YIG nuclease family protein [Candidatus Woesebacteria bacterium]